MASKIQSHNFYVAITPYKVQGVEDQYNELSVFTSYNEHVHQFYVSLHAGWKSTFGHGSMIMGDSNPLTASTMVYVKESPRNSQKTINEIGAALELAKDIIAALFDDREWDKLRVVVQNVARFGYVEQYKEQAEKYLAERVSKRYEKAIKPTEPVVKQVDVMGLMGALQTKGKAKLSDFAKPIESESNEKENNSNQETMAQNVKAADLIGKTIVVGDNQATIVIKSVDGDKLSGEFSKDGKTTPMSFPVSQLQGMTEKGLWKIQSGECRTESGEFATAATTDVTTEADVAEVDDIKPVVKPKAKPVEEEPDPDAVGELVYEEPKAKAEPIKPTAKPKQEKPKAKSVVGSMYRVELLPTKDGQKWPKLYGFKDESEAKKTAGKMAKTVTYSWDRDEQGEKRYYLKGGKKYCEVFQQLADALNIGEKAVIDKVCKASVAIFEGARAEGKKKSEGRGKTEDVHQPSAVSPQTSTEKTYTAAEVMDLIQRMAKKDPKALAEYEAMLQAA